MTVKKRNLQKIPLAILILLLTILHVPSVNANGYYADINIKIDNSGFVTIEGESNHPGLLVENTERYTFKKQSYWLLNITKKEVFSDFIFTVTMPKDSSINYVKSTGFIKIEEKLGNLVIEGFGQNKSLSIIIQYQIKKPSENHTDILLRLFLIIFTVISITSLLTLILSKTRETKTKPMKSEDEYKGFNLKGLNDRQKDIMKLLIERKRPLTQTDIQRELKIPKAAVSRNIRGLELKGLIEKEKIGMSNLIRLKKN